MSDAVVRELRRGDGQHFAAAVRALRNGAGPAVSTGLCPHCLIGMYPDEEAGRRIWYCGDCGYETPRRAVARKKETVVMELSA